MQKVVKNTGIILFGDIVFRLVSLVVTIYLARYLGKEGYGIYNFIFAYLAFFNIITDLGLQKILVREIARNPDNTPKLIGNAYIIRVILTFIAILLANTIISVTSYPKDIIVYVYLASITLLFISFSDFYATVFEANLKMKYRVAAKLAFKFSSAIFILIIILYHGTLFHVIVALVISEFIKTAVSYIFYRKITYAKFEIDFSLWKYLMKESLPLTISSVVWIIHSRTDVIMLSAMVGNAEVGVYSAATKLTEPLMLIPSALMASLFPIMSASFRLETRLAKICKFSVKYNLIIMLPIAIGTTLMADKIILLLYGSEFIASAYVLQIIIWGVLLSSVGAVFPYLFISTNQQKFVSTISILSASINVLLNFILISLLASNGAAIATVITRTISISIYLYLVLKVLSIYPFDKSFVKQIFSCIIVTIFIYLLNIISCNIFFIILISIVIYILVLFATKTISDEEISIFREILKTINLIK